MHFITDTLVVLYNGLQHETWPVTASEPAHDYIYHSVRIGQVHIWVYTCSSARNFSRCKQSLPPGVRLLQDSQAPEIADRCTNFGSWFSPHSCAT